MFNNRYNSRADEWMLNGIYEFDGLNFLLNNEPMSEVTTTDGLYYPIRDRCNEPDDPPGGCLTTDALYYEAFLQRSTTINIVIKYGTTIILSESYSSSVNNIYNIFDLGCENDLYRI